MRLITKKLPPKDEPATLKLVAEEVEDMWHTYNLVRAGDSVTAKTFRKVTSISATGQGSSIRVTIKLTINVEATDFDPVGQEIRIRGRNLIDTEYVRAGAYHTLEIEPDRPFEITKQSWDILDLDRLKQACDPAASADLAAVLITEGLAHLCLIGSATTLQKAKIEMTMPRKRGAAAAGYDTAYKNFLNRVMTAVERHIDWEIVKCLVVAGPGFVKDDFKKHLEEEAVRRDLRPLILNKSKVLLASASSAYQHSIKEILANPAISSQIKDTKALRETKVLQEFYSMLSHDSARAFYGPGHIREAHELAAIGTLLVTDTVLLVHDVNKRKALAKLKEEVEAGGGEVVVFSGMHSSGDQLNKLTGMAAILRFPLPDLEDAELDPEL